MTDHNQEPGEDFNNYSDENRAQLDIISRWLLGRNGSDDVQSMLDQSTTGKLTGEQIQRVSRQYGVRAVIIALFYSD